MIYCKDCKKKKDCEWLKDLPEGQYIDDILCEERIYNIEHIEQRLARLETMHFSDE